MIEQNREEDFPVDPGVRSGGNLVCMNFDEVDLNPFLHRVVA